MLRKKTLQLSVIFFMFSCLLLPAHAEEPVDSLIPVLSLLLFSSKDCNGDNHGTAYLDTCDNCVGGNTGESPCSVVETVTSTGQTWMDRNLGAARVATSSTDADAYGDLYQWGRLADGHEKRTSPTTTTLSPSDVPGHGNFITTSSYPYDWRSPQNANLWQGVSGVNNPCPSGFRLPTETEWETERASWGGNNNSTGALNSPLKLVPAGYRHVGNGTLDNVGSYGLYWSATVSGSSSSNLSFLSGDAFMYSLYRANGHSVRCLKD